VHLVDKQDDLALGPADLVEHALQSLLELAAILGPGDQRAHVERHQPAVLQAVGHIAIGDAQRHALCNRRLADAGFADQHRIILGPARQYLDRASDFLVAANHRVELAVTRGLGQVAGIFLHRLVALLGRGAVGRASTAQLVDRAVQRFGGHARGFQRLAGRRLLGEQQGEQQPFHGDIAVARLFRDLLGLIEYPDRIIVQPRCLLGTATGNRRNLGQHRVNFLMGLFGVTAGPGDQARRHSLIILEQGLGEMRRGYLLMAHPDGNGLGGLQKSFGAVGEFLKVHRFILFSLTILSRIWCCTRATQPY